jgi:hypothetical protein
MKKLLTLTEITFKTGENVYKELFQVLVEVPHDAVQNDVTEEVCRVVKQNFTVWFPESTLESVVPKPTIADVSVRSEKKGETFYAASAMIDFSNWVLKEFQSKYAGDVAVEHLEHWKKKFNK